MQGNKRGRPKKAAADKAPRCGCRGTSGFGICKEAIYSHSCGQCKRACKANSACANIASPRNRQWRTSSPARTRRRSGALFEHSEGFYAEVSEFTPTKTKPVTHCDLSRATATVSDLAIAFGRSKFFLSSARKTLESLRAAMQSRKQYGRVPESDDDGMVVEESKEGGVEDEEEGGGDRSDGRSSGDSEDESSSSSSSSSSLATRYQGPIAPTRAAVAAGFSSRR